MGIVTKIISSVIIKPSSPTPKSLQKHRLSFLDQLMPPIYSSFVYFYPSNPTLLIPNSQKSMQLKKSLPDLLSTFYPLAGRLVGNGYVDCNDGGAPFADAEADCRLSDAISQPDPEDMVKFLPYETHKHQDFCVAVQATRFRCGGLSLGILLSHKLGDGLSFISFANAWSSIVRNGGGAPPPKFDGAAYFPPLDVLASPTPAAAFVTGEEVGTGKLFRFPASTISALQETYAAGDHRPSPVLALSAFIWTRYIAAAGLKSDPDKICTVRTVVNLRTRRDPPLSGDHFGNFVGAAVVRAAAGDGGVEFVRKLREAVKAVDGGHVARMKNSEKHLEEMMSKASDGERVGFDFSSISGFPWYEADFGWGRPVWVGLGPLPLNNVALLVDAERGGGIEACIYLPKQHMGIFETHLSS